LAHAPAGNNKNTEDNVMKLLSMAAMILLSSSLACYGETLTGHLMPSKCKNEDPTTHTRDCALSCQASGCGVLTASAEYLSFEAAANAKVLELLRSTEKADDLRVSGQGTRKGSVLAVESISWK
jgi:hypothetical protein